MRLSLIPFVTRLAAIAAVVALPLSARAQDADSQLWTLVTFQARTAQGVRFYAEVQPRLGENFSHWTQFLARPAVGYQVNKCVSLWVGYGWTPNLRPEFNGENRIFQQVLVENSFPRFQMQNRTRLEQRFIEGVDGTSWRIRHQLRVAVPLEPTKHWSAVTYGELFWHLNSPDKGPESGFDQIRPYVGLGYQWNKQTRMEVGYMATYINPPRDAPDRRLDTLVLTLNYTL